MTVWIVILKVFGYLWTTLTGLVILVGIAGVWMKSGFSAVQDLLSPFNVVNWLVTAVTLAPGIASLMWAEKLKKRQGRGNEVA